VIYNGRKIELLAPAKNLEVGRVAIEAGADAVYIGGPSFGARKAAGNSLEDIRQLCEYAHLYDAQVLVTLNTLLRDEEMPEAVGLAYQYRAIGVDAIIIQDLRLAEILFRSGDFPRCNQSDNDSSDAVRTVGENAISPTTYNLQPTHQTFLHASTQCDNRNAERVKELEAMGFRRVVLARELSYEEIAEVRRQTSCELEAFVHGALCVSYSGACYLSEAVCGRSANRGECAQMCRLAYDVLDEEKREILHQKHILSLRDLDRSGSLTDLLNTGVTTLKIEGRLKDADYVRNVVAYYRQKLDELSDKTLVTPVRHSFTPNPEKTFHRGATEYFAYSRPDHLVNLDTPKSTGEFLGRAPLSREVIAQLHNGDGITFGGDGFYWPNNRVRIPNGVEVYRNLDVEFQRQLTAKNACVRVLPVAIRMEETAAGYILSMSDRRYTVSLPVTCEKEPAQNPERALSVVQQQLSKLGGTGLEAASVDVAWSAPAFLPASVLNDWRRQLVERFLALFTHVASPDHSAETLASIPDLLSSESFTHLQIYKFTNSQLPAELMTCRYCILNELGCCKTRHPRKSGVPTYLRQNGLLLRIHTDCAKCQMTLTFGEK